MEIYLSPPDRSAVTVDTMTGFLSDLVTEGFIDADTGVQHVSYEHSDEADLSKRIGETFEKPTLDEAIRIIADNGVEWISVSLKADSHYAYKGPPEGRGKLTTIMYCLNNAAADVADHLGEQIQTDYYFSPSFQSGRYHTEYGVGEVCTLTLPGEGGNIPYERMDECMGVLRESMKKEGPAFEELIDLMTRHFGEISLSFGYNDLG